MEYSIGKKIKELRVEVKMTQKQLAELIGKSPTGVASWEQGISEPCINDLRMLCSIFDVSADYLLGINE